MMAVALIGLMRGIEVCVHDGGTFEAEQHLVTADVSPRRAGDRQCRCEGRRVHVPYACECASVRTFVYFAVSTIWCYYRREGGDGAHFVRSTWSAS